MTQTPDLNIPLSALVFDSDTHATATAADWDTTQIGVLLQHVVQRHAEGVLDQGNLHTVSVTFDVSADATAGTDVDFDSQIDRKTRTLIFASGHARHEGKTLLRATIVFRIG